MSEVPSGSWDSPASENFARDGRAATSRDGSGGPDPAQVHGWYTDGLALLAKGSPAAAAQLLQRAANAEPGSRSVREALARAQFDSGQYTAAADNFRVIVDASPTDDYAHFGLGLSLARAGDPAAAAEYLALAAAMRPTQGVHRRAAPGAGHPEVPPGTALGLASCPSRSRKPTTSSCSTSTASSTSAVPPSPARPRRCAGPSRPAPTSPT